MLTAVHLLAQQNTLAGNQNKHFSIEKSGTKWAIHDSFIDSIDLCEEGLFVSECICCRQEQEM